MKTRYLIPVVFVTLAALLMLATRSAREPASAYITLTPGAPAAANPSAPDNNDPASAVAQAPTVIFGPISTAPPISATPAPTLPSGATFGPIVGPDHTLEPTEAYLPPTLPPTVIPTPGPSPTTGPTLGRDLMGIQIHPHIDNHEFNQALGSASALGVTWVKYQFNWSLLESAPGQYTELFYMLRLYVQATHKQGFKVMISVAKAPGWARTPESDGTMRENGPPDDPQALASFLSGMLNQIGRDADGAPYINAIEVWNEPNLQREWYRYPLTGEDYMRYFRPAYDAIRGFSPDITIITGAPAPTGDSDGSTNDRLWLQGLYNAGLAQYGQNVAVGIHPYSWANSPDARCCAIPSRGWDEFPQFYFLNTIEDYRDIMVANNHSNAQLWATEFGWATFDGLKTGSGAQPPDPKGQEFYSYINQGQQADYTLRAFTLAQERPYMGPMILWNLNFAAIPGAVDQSDPQTGYALLDSAWQPRPVYQAIRQAPKS